MSGRPNVAASLLAVLATFALPAAARAEDPPDRLAASAAAPGGEVAPPSHIGYGAMPGAIHVPSAETLPPGTAVLGVISGYGYRSGLVGADHTMNRAIGQIAAAYAPLAGLLVGLSLDGRYDRHTIGDTTDSNYVGDPHLLARYAVPLGQLAIGAQLGIWLPGKNAPSIAGSATSVDARVVATYDAGPAVLSAAAGFRLDNSAKSVDDPEHLSLADRASLGASDHHAVLAGVSARVPLGPRLYLGAEGSADVFVGHDAPGGIYRAGAMLGFAVNDALSIVGYAEGAKVPRLAFRDAERMDLVLVPYEPTITGGVAVQARFGGPGHRRASQIVENARPAAVAVVETAEVSGTVVDDTGRPVVGARITVRLKNHTGTAISDDKGAYTVSDLPIGKTVDGKTELDDTGAEITVEVASKKLSTATLTLTKGGNVAPRITLDPVLPPGQLRAVIINVATSRPVAGATVTISPGDATATSGPDGKFTMDLPPGHYRITVTAKGLAQQQLDVNIDPNGVAIKNIDMHR